MSDNAEAKKPRARRTVRERAESARAKLDRAQAEYKKAKSRYGELKQRLDDEDRKKRAHDMIVFAGDVEKIISASLGGGDVDRAAVLVAIRSNLGIFSGCAASGEDGK